MLQRPLTDELFLFPCPLHWPVCPYRTTDWQLQLLLHLLVCKQWNQSLEISDNSDIIKYVEYISKLLP